MHILKVFGVWNKYDILYVDMIKISSRSLEVNIILDFYPLMLFKVKEAKKERFCSIHIPQLLKCKIIEGI